MSVVRLADDHLYGKIAVHQCYEGKCITAVLLKFTPQVIVGKYGTSSVSSKLMNR